MRPGRGYKMNPIVSRHSTQPQWRTGLQSDGEQTRVLLGEPDGEMRSVLASALRREGYQVVATQDATGLLDLLEAAQDEEGELAPFDAVLVDVTLPGQPRYGLLPQIRRIDAELPVVVMTSFEDSPSRAEAFDRGADAVLDKPFDIDAVRTVLRILISPTPS